jgi:YD repeat-containing protein
MAAPTRQAIDVFQLGVDWEPQSSTQGVSFNRATSTDRYGEVDLQSVYGAVEAISVPYKYTGADAFFNDALFAANAWPGQVTASGDIVTGISIDYATAGEGQKPVITITGRDIPDGWVPDYACDAQYEPSIALPTDPCGIVDPLGNTDPDSEITSYTYSLEAQVGVDTDADGEEINIALYGAEENISVSYYGTPTLPEFTGWVITSEDLATSGTEYSTTGLTLVKGMSHFTTTTTTTA